MTAYPTSKSSARDNGRIRLWVIHDEEYPESVTSAEATCAYLTKPSVRASIHFAVDADSSPDSVPLDRAAWHANHGKTNACSIGVEHDGYAHQTRAEWLDDVHGEKTLDRSARLFAEVGMGRYGIQPVHLRGQALVDCVNGGVGSGYCGHGDVTRAFGIVGGHTDPGDHFPFDWWELRARQHAGLVSNFPAEVPSPQPSEEDDEMKILFVQTAGDTRVVRCTAGMGDPILMRSEEQLAHTYALAFEQGVQVLGKIGEGGFVEWQGPTRGIPVRKIDPQYFGELAAAAR